MFQYVVDSAVDTAHLIGDFLAQFAHRHFQLRVEPGNHAVAVHEQEPRQPRCRRDRADEHAQRDRCFLIDDRLGERDIGRYNLAMDQLPSNRPTGNPDEQDDGADGVFRALSHGILITPAGDAPAGAKAWPRVAQ